MSACSVCGERHAWNDDAVVAATLAARIAELEAQLAAARAALAACREVAGKRAGR